MHGWIEPSSSWQPKAEANSTADTRVSNGKAPEQQYQCQRPDHHLFWHSTPAASRQADHLDGAARGNARATPSVWTSASWGMGGRGRFSCRANRCRNQAGSASANADQSER